LRALKEKKVEVLVVRLPVIRKCSAVCKRRDCNYESELPPVIGPDLRSGVSTSNSMKQTSTPQNRSSKSSKKPRPTHLL
jgi:hypothetical protein